MILQSAAVKGISIVTLGQLDEFVVSICCSRYRSVVFEIAILRHVFQHVFDASWDLNVGMSFEYVEESHIASCLDSCPESHDCVDMWMSVLVLLDSHSCPDNRLDGRQ